MTVAPGGTLDAFDPTGRDRASHKPNPMGRRQVGGVMALPCDQGGVFEPANRPAHPSHSGTLGGCTHQAARSSARRVTARTRSRRYCASDWISSMGSTACGGGLCRLPERRELGRASVQDGFGFGNPPRSRLGAANSDTRLDDDAIGKPIRHQRHRDGEIAGATIEFTKAEARLIGNNRQANLGEQLIFRQRGRHDPFEEIVGRDDALSARAAHHHLRRQRRCNETPFRCGIGMGDAAAERAARPDRIVRDMAHDGREQTAHGPVHDRTMERRMANNGADRQDIADAGLPGEFRNSVDVDEMCGTSDPERHDRNKALSARQHAAIFGTKLGKHGDSFVDRSRSVTIERLRSSSCQCPACGGHSIPC